MRARSLTLAEAASLAGARLVGEGDLRIDGIAPVGEAGPHHLGLLADGRYTEEARDSGAGAFLVAVDLEADAPADRPRLVVDDPHAALPALLERLHPTPTIPPGIHPTAIVADDADIGADVTIAGYAVIESGAVVGRGVRVGSHAVIGRDVRIGEETILHPHVVVYPGTVLGRRVVAHAGARLGVDGFGYASVDGRFVKVPQVGRLVVDDDVEIGANTCIDRGSIGDTIVGTGTKIDNLVHIAHNVRVGEHCAMAALVGVSGSVRIGRGVVFGGQVGTAGHIEIGDGARLGGQAGVIGDIAPGKTVLGFPARESRAFLRASALMLRLPEMARELRALREEVDRLGHEQAPDEPDPE